MWSRAWLLLGVLGVSAMSVVGCGGGSSSSTTASSRPAVHEPTSLSGCIEAWNGQGVEAKAEATIFSVREGDYEAWVSVYEGPPLRLKAGDFSEKFSGRHCLVSIPAEEVVWFYEEGDWHSNGYGSQGGPLYEYATESQAAHRAEITKNANLKPVT
jgi:hypothetical protein